MAWEGLLLALSPAALVAVLLGVFVGIVIGIVPGIGAGVGLALLLPLVFRAPPLVGLMLLLALWAADGYGASITSILLNVPGGAGAVATTFDGYPMARQGKAGVAIGLAMAASMVAGILGTVILMLAAPPLGRFAVKIGPAEYTVLAVLGLTMIGSLSGKQPIKGLISACLGLMVSFVGYDLISGFVRFNFGTLYLFDGIEFTTLLIGLFAISELVDAAREGGTIAELGKVTGRVIDGFKLAFRYPLSLLRGSLVGSVLGCLPGIGITVASLVAYDAEKRSSRTPERFGKGAPEGVIAPEAANNSTQPASLIPALTLGIPAGSTSAIFLGALVMYGFMPGPDLFKSQGSFVWALFWGIILASVAYVIVGLTFSNFFVRLTVLPVEYLVPVTLVTCLVGAYSINNKFPDMITAVVFGAIGYLMLTLKYPVAPAVLGTVLGPILERNFYRALLMSEGSYLVFVRGPVCWLLWVLVVIVVAYPYLAARRGRAR